MTVMLSLDKYPQGAEAAWPCLASNSIKPRCQFPHFCILDGVNTPGCVRRVSWGRRS